MEEWEPGTEESLRGAMAREARGRALGEPVAMFRARLKTAGEGPALWGLIALGVVLLGVTLWIGSPALVLLVIVLIVLGVVLVRRRRDAGAGRGETGGARRGGGVQIVRIHENGAVWGLARGSREPELRVYTWPEVTAFRVITSETTHQAGLLSATTRLTSVVMSHDGLPDLALNGSARRPDPALNEAAGALRSTYGGYLVRAALAALNRGETFSFGAAEATPEGIAVKRKVVPWGHVSGFKTVMVPDGTGGQHSELSIRDPNGKAAAWVRHDKLLHAEAFIQLTRTVVGRPL